MDADTLKVLRGAFEDELRKIAFDITPEKREHMAKSTFAVPAKKSNTGEPAYPIPDEQHARSALGFAKMHGDTADYASVRAKIEKKFPQLLHKESKAAVLPDGSGFFTGTVGKKGKEKDSNMMQGGEYGAAALPTTFKAPSVGGTLGGGGPKVAMAAPLLKRLASDAGTHKAELAGLGILAAPAVDRLQAVGRARMAGDKTEHGVEKRQLMGDTAHALTEAGGLGVLAGPSIAHLMGHGAH